MLFLGLIHCLHVPAYLGYMMAVGFYHACAADRKSVFLDRMFFSTVYAVLIFLLYLDPTTSVQSGRLREDALRIVTSWII